MVEAIEVLCRFLAANRRDERHRFEYGDVILDLPQFLCIAAGLRHPEIPPFLGGYSGRFPRFRQIREGGQKLLVVFQRIGRGLRFDKGGVPERLIVEQFDVIFPAV
jgi:hypothetical protein